MNLEWLQKNWDVLASAPFAFVTCVVGSFLVAFAIVSYFKNSEITILERRVTDYESKLKVGSPDEAKSKVDRLEGEIAGVNRVLNLTIGKPWDPLKPHEIADLSSKLAYIPKMHVHLMYQNQLGKDLAQSVHEAFQKAGWSDVLLSDGGGSTVGIIAGPGTNQATLMKSAFEGSTKLKISIDKPTALESPGSIYLLIGINVT
jgi:hypothetical protein